jgi:hypothetical protein
MLIKELERLIKPIVTDGYKYKKGNMVFLWTKNVSDRREDIILGYRTFYPNMFQLEKPSAYILFDEVENILNSILNEYGITQHYGDYTIKADKIIYPLEGIDYSKFETKIHDEASFQIVAEEIKKIVKYGAMPFFERYQTLEEVHNYANQLSLEEYSHFFSGYGSLKMMIIKRLLNVDDYESYSYQMIQDWINTAKEYPQHFENLDKVVVDLKNVLDKI